MHQTLPEGLRFLSDRYLPIGQKDKILCVLRPSTLLRAVSLSNGGSVVNNKCKLLDALIIISKIRWEIELPFFIESLYLSGGNQER